MADSQNITLSRRAILAGTATLPALAAPLAGSSASATDIPAMCAAILALYAESAADHEPDIDIPIPTEISAAAIFVNPDFADLGDEDRETIERMGAVMPRHVAARLKEAEAPKTIEVCETEEGRLIKMLKVPIPPSEEQLERAGRLRPLLAIAEDFHEATWARQCRLGAWFARRDDESCRIECRLVDTYSATTADLVAKAELYEDDPERSRYAVTGAARASTSPSCAM